MVTDAVAAGHKNHRGRTVMAGIHAIVASAAGYVRPLVGTHEMVGRCLNGLEAPLIKLHSRGIGVQRPVEGDSLSVLSGNG